MTTGISQTYGFDSTSTSGPSADGNYSLFAFGTTTGTVTVSVSTGTNKLYCWLNTGAQNNGSWDDGGTNTLLLKLTSTNSSVDARVRILSLAWPGTSILQGGTFTGWQTLSADRTFSVVAPTWTHTEACNNILGYEIEFDNTASHGGDQSVTIDCSSTAEARSDGSYVASSILYGGNTCAPEFNQKDFRIRDDDGSETGATWLQAINTNDSINTTTNFRLRFNIENQGNTTGGGLTSCSAPLLEYSLNSGAWTQVTLSSSVIKIVDSTHFTNGDDCTQQLGSGTFESNNNAMLDASTRASSWTINISWANADQTEIEWCLSIVNADVSNGDTIDLRMYNFGNVNGIAITMGTYTNTPRITVIKAAGGGPVLIHVGVI